MRTLALFLACAAPARASGPSWEARVRAALPAGLELPAPPVTALGQAVLRPLPPRLRVADTASVDLRPVFERHLARTSSYRSGSGRVAVSGTLDLNGDGYLAVTVPGEPARFFKIQRGMSGRWRHGTLGYSVSLSVSIFRPRLNNYIVIKDDDGATVWEMQIRELFRQTYAAGEPVVLAGRPYRLFYSRQPDGSGREGLCFIYEDTSSGAREYSFYLIPVEQVLGAAPTSYRMFGGDQVRLRVTPDRATLEIGR
ncbi:MAG: hypothetical protein SF051_06280 [Elusimicrobiota bacterium]|nr:hypothetical protein [Elusimicrobiota bacterium]